METNIKVIASGTCIEVFRFLDGVLEYGMSRPKHKLVGDVHVDPTTGYRYQFFDEGERLVERRLRDNVLTEEEKALYKAQSARRASAQFRRLIESNFGMYKKSEGVYYPTVVLSTTFQHKSYKLLEQTNPIFSLFIKRLNYKFYGNDRSLMYVAVPEWQGRGVVHYHTVLFNMEYLEQKILQDIWEVGITQFDALKPKGIVDIRKWKGSTSLGFYLSKYLAKNFKEPLLEGKKKYFPSRGLKRSEVFYDQSIAGYISSSIPPGYRVKSTEFSSRYVGGRVVHEIYKLPPTITYKDFLLKADTIRV